MICWFVYLCRFANEVPAVAASHVDAEVLSAGSTDQQVVASTAAESAVISDDTAGDSVVAADVVNDERPLDDGKETVDASANRSQC